MVTLDELGKGLDGGVDAVVLTDIFLGLRAACPSPEQVGGFHYNGDSVICRGKKDPHGVR